MSLRKGYDFVVQPQEVDFQCRITLSALTAMLLNTADYNANDNGFGLKHLQTIDCSWVLSRFVLEMEYFPLEYEELTVETWVEEVGRASTSRNFCVKNAQQEIIGHGISIWVMLDMSTRKIKDLSLLENIWQYVHPESVPIEKPIKLTPVKDGTVYNSFCIRYSDIDFNGHVSTARYVRWLSDCFSLKQYESTRITRFEASFMNEMMYGDQVEVLGEQKTDNDYRFDILNGDKIACRARLVFSDKEKK